MGKNWARGLTKETDARVARAAAGHRGLEYNRRALGGPGQGDRRIRWPRIRYPATEDQWTPDFAYAIGLLATDGGLVGNKAVTLTSADREQVVTFRSCVGAQHPVGANQGAYRVQITDVRFHRWLISVGITPRKSLTLGPLRVPDRLLVHTFRGLFDGDGSIYTGVTTPNRKRYPLHTYQRLHVRFHSASRAHIDWLRAKIDQILGLKGWVTIKKPKDTRYAPMWVLRYSKHESIELLTAMYADVTAARLDRKWRRWADFRDRGKPTRRWTKGGSRRPKRVRDHATIELEPE